MVKVKIINGVYGHREGQFVRPKTVSSPPFLLDKGKADKLVLMGVAEYADGEVIAPETIAPETVTANKDMEVSEIREIMNELGIPYKVGMTKAEMLDLIEQPPIIGAEDIVL